MLRRLNHNTASPSGMRALAVAYGHVRQSGLPVRLIDLVFLRVSQINGCAFCVDAHARDLVDGGLPVEHLILVSVWTEAGGVFDEVERAALAWAEAVTRLGDDGVSDEAYAAAAAMFSDTELADLTIAIGLMNAYNRLGVSFRPKPAALAARSFPD